MARTCKCSILYVAYQFINNKKRPDILNEFGIAASCLGNHDFDFGMPQLEKLLRQTNFPWLLSNVLDSESPSGAKYIKRYLVIEQPQSGLRIGLIGLVEK